MRNPFIHLHFFAAISFLFVLTPHAEAQDNRIVEAESPFAPLCHNEKCPQIPLEAAKFKSILLQFFDPSESGLSEPLTYLLYRQWFDSVSDVQGSGIVRLLPADGEKSSNKDLAERLVTTPAGDHALAENLADALGARLAAWGTLIADDNRISMTVSLTSSKAGVWRGDESPVDITASRKLSVPLPPLDRLNLGTTTASLSDIYGKTAIVRCARSNNCPKGDLLLFDIPDSSSQGDAMTGGEELTIDVDGERRPVGKFVPVVTDSGKKGWVYSYHLSYVPREVYLADRVAAPLRSQPTSNASIIKVLSGPSRFNVISLKTQNEKRWYYVELATGPKGWVQFGDVRPVWTAPFIHLVAAIHRRAQGYHESARAELELFLSMINHEESNVSTSFALQLMASSYRLEAGQPGTDRVVRSVIESLDSAAALTPLDPAPFYARAFAKASVQLDWRADIAAAKSNAEGDGKNTAEWVQLRRFETAAERRGSMEWQ